MMISLSGNLRFDGAAASSVSSSASPAALPCASSISARFGFGAIALFRPWARANGASGETPTNQRPAHEGTLGWEWLMDHFDPRLTRKVLPSEWLRWNEFAVRRTLENSSKWLIFIIFLLW